MHVVILLGLHPQTLTGVPPLNFAVKLSSPDPLICPPVEKILRLPMDINPPPSAMSCVSEIVEAKKLATEQFGFQSG